MTPKERDQYKKDLRAVHEMRMRQGMVRMQLALTSARGNKTSMAEVCQIYEMLFPQVATHLVMGIRSAEERELRLQVFREIMADCKKEAFRWDT